jgi:nudix-type nucleoside diphosphatase (YffH/AdpP family)
LGEEIRVIETKLLSDNWGTLTKYDFEQRHRDGVWRRHQREVYDRGHAAVVLLCNPETNTVILTRQFRLPVQIAGDHGMLIEACAGLLEGDDPEACARKEAEEETGFRVKNLKHLFDSYMSPGSVTEKLSFFTAEYDDTSRISGGGGLAHEGEDIEVIEYAFPRALEMVASGEIIDAKTIMLLQHVALSGAMRP